MSFNDCLPACKVRGNRVPGCNKRPCCSRCKVPCQDKRPLCCYNKVECQDKRPLCRYDKVQCQDKRPLCRYNKVQCQDKRPLCSHCKERGSDFSARRSLFAGLRRRDKLQGHRVANVGYCQNRRLNRELNIWNAGIPFRNAFFASVLLCSRETRMFDSNSLLAGTPDAGPVIQSAY